MRTVNLTIEGDEYVAVAKEDYLRLVAGRPESVDALEYVLLALGRNLKAARRCTQSATSAAKASRSATPPDAAAYLGHRWAPRTAANSSALTGARA